MEIIGHIEQLMNFVEEVEVDEAVAYLEEIAAYEGNNYVVDKILDKFLLRIGERWEAGEGISITDTYVSSKIVTMFLESIPSVPIVPDSSKRVVFGNIKNDFQSSGRQLVIRFLEMDGWEVIDLGNDVAPERFCEVAKAEDIRFIGVSAMLYENALHIKALSELLENYFDDDNRPYLVAGGAIFTILPNLIDELYVNYTAMNAFEAKKLFAELYEEASND